MYSWLSVDAHQRRGLRALQIAIGLMMLFRASTEFRFAAFLWGPSGIGQGSSSAFLGAELGRWLDRLYDSELGVQGMLLVLAAAAACLVIGVHTRLAAFASLIAVRFFESRLSELGDGGDNVTRLVLTYMVFALPAHRVAKPGSLPVWLHNVAILAIGLQIAVVYLTSGMLKLTGERWANGTALYTISQVEWFSNPSFRDLFKNPTFSALATYTTVFFQIWFPVAVLTRLKPVWLLVGIGMHVGIAMFMGLVCFSTAMIGLELFLITDGEFAALEGRLRRWNSRLRAGWLGRGSALHEWPSLKQLWNVARFRGKVAP
jgi:hypothetical protein